MGIIRITHYWKKKDRWLMPRLTKMNVDKLINEAKSRYPLSLYYKGRLNEDEIERLCEKCDIHCSSVYMDGSAMYSIRYMEMIENTEE